jgi:hypothetical protein
MPIPEAHRTDPTTIPCQNIAAEIAAVERSLAQAEAGVRAADARRENADREVAAAHAAHNQLMVTFWKNVGDQALADRKAFHAEQERLRTWLNEAKHQAATRCFINPTAAEPPKVAVSTGKPKLLAAAGAAIASTALAVGMLWPGSASPKPMVAPAGVSRPAPKPKPKVTPKQKWFYLELKAVDETGSEVGGGAFQVKTTGDLTTEGPQTVSEGMTAVLSVPNPWEGTVSYQPPAGWVVVGENPSGGHVRVRPSGVDNGFNFGLDRRYAPDGTTYYQVVFQVRKHVVERPPSRPTDGPLGDPHDLDNAPPSRTHVGPTTPLGGSAGRTEERKPATGTSSSSSRCTSNGYETRCSSGDSSQHEDEPRQTSDSGSTEAPHETAPSPTTTQPPRSEQQMDTTVGAPVITYG